MVATVILKRKGKETEDGNCTVCIRCWMNGGNDPKLFDKFVSHWDCIYKSPSDIGPDDTNDCNPFFDFLDLHLIQNIALISYRPPTNLFAIIWYLSRLKYSTYTWQFNGRVVK